MKSMEELKEIASKIWDLELKCQNGEDVSKNTKEMNRIASGLQVEEILKLTEILEEKHLTF